EMVKARLSALGLDAGALGRCRVAAIGPATAEALSSVGLPATVVPEEYVAEGLARALAALVRPGQRVLLARAAETRDFLVREPEIVAEEYTIAGLAAALEKYYKSKGAPRH